MLLNAIINKNYVEQYIRDNTDKINFSEMFHYVVKETKYEQIKHDGDNEKFAEQLNLAREKFREIIEGNYKSNALEQIAEDTQKKEMKDADDIETQMHNVKVKFNELVQQDFKNFNMTDVMIDVLSLRYKSHLKTFLLENEAFDDYEERIKKEWELGKNAYKLSLSTMYSLKGLPCDTSRPIGYGVANLFENGSILKPACFVKDEGIGKLARKAKFEYDYIDELNLRNQYNVKKYKNGRVIDQKKDGWSYMNVACKTPCGTNNLPKEFYDAKKDAVYNPYCVADYGKKKRLVPCVTYDKNHFTAGLDLTVTADMWNDETKKDEVKDDVDELAEMFGNRLKPIYGNDVDDLAEMLGNKLKPIYGNDVDDLADRIASIRMS
jgi:hypothetical protein